MAEPSPKTQLREIFAAALDAVRGEGLIASRSRLDGEVWRYSHDGQRIDWRLPRGGRVLAVGGGKAAASLARGLEAVLGDRLDGGVIVVKHDHCEPLTKVRCLEGGHPIPDQAGLEATQHMLAALDGLTRDDRVFVLLSGGASALLAAPAEGLTLADEAAVNGALLRSRAAIEEINTVRKRLSRVKGGGLLAAIAPAQSLTLTISDVPSNDPAMIGSGPTQPDAAAPGEALAVLRRYGLEDAVPKAVIERLQAAPLAIEEVTPGPLLLLAGSGDALAAAKAKAQALGYAVEIVDPGMDGETHATAAAFVTAMKAAAARRRAGGPACVLLSAGETTLQVKGGGKGGRNQEFALVAAGLIEGEDGMALLSAGTDGTDGPTDAAGAFADGGSLARARSAGRDPAAALADNDSYPLFAALGDLLVTGPTGTNVMDLVIGIVA